MSDEIHSGLVHVGPPRALGAIFGKELGRFAKVRRVVATFLMVLGALLVGTPQAAVPGNIGPGNIGIVLEVDGAIGPATADYMVRGLEEAAARDAAIVLFRIDTPGGLDTSMRDIIRAILASPVPVVSYVGPGGARAASAGTYILYASHIAAMAPGTNLGAATPVSIGGGGMPFFSGDDEGADQEIGDDATADDDPTDNAPSAAPQTAMESKVINDAVAYIRSLAEMRGRNADWAESAVRQAASLSANEALAENVIDIVAPNFDDLLDQIDGRVVIVGDREVTIATNGLSLETIAPDWRNQALSVITDPNVAMILMMIGFYGLFLEFYNPGALYPGTIGAICLLIGLYALAALPLNYAGLGLIFLGVAFLVAEMFSPSFGILGIGGAISFTLGAIFLVDTDLPGLRISWSVIAGIAVTSVAFSLLIAQLAVASFRHKVMTGPEEMIGMSGQVMEWAGSAGRVLVHSERWNAVADVPLAPGQEVHVVRMDGLTLTVEPAGTQAA